MLKAAITAPLTKSEVKGLTQFLSHHLGYVPHSIPNVVFARTAVEYASLYDNWRNRTKDISEERIDEIAKIQAYFDHFSNSAVFKGFSYVEGTEIPGFIIPMGTVIHELIHSFQYATGTFGSYRVMYEGSNDILSCLLTDDPKIDYKEEAKYAMSLAMEITGHDPMAAFQWMRTYNTHSDKNDFVHRSIKQCPTLSRYNPRQLMLLLDKGKIDRIKNEETIAILTRYGNARIVKLCREGFKIINGII